MLTQFSVNRFKASVIEILLGFGFWKSSKAWVREVFRTLLNIFLMMLFCENSGRLLDVNCLGNNTASKMFDSPANIYLFKVNNRNTRKRCEICWKLTIKTPDDVVGIVPVFLYCYLKTFLTHFSGVFVGDFEQEIVSWEVVNTPLISGANSLPSKLWNLNYLQISNLKYLVNPSFWFLL